MGIEDKSRWWQSTSRGRGSIILLAILLSLIVVAFAGYSNTLNAFFVADDFEFLRVIKEEGVLGIPVLGSTSFFRPLVSLLWFVDHSIWGLNPLGFHGTNVLFHCLNAFLLALIFSLLFRDAENTHRRPVLTLSFLSALVFLTMPCHTEAVSWISGRTDVLAAFFSLASFYAYLLYSRDGHRLFGVVSALLYLLGLLSKESAVTCPVLVLLFELILVIERSESLRQARQRGVYVLSVYGVVFAAYLVVRYSYLGAVIGGYGTSVHLHWDAGSIIGSCGDFVLKTLLPVGLMDAGSLATYRPFVGATFLAASFLCSLVVIVGSTKYSAGKSLREYSRHSLVCLGLGGFWLVSLIPVMSLGVCLWDTQGDRYLYFSSAFAALLLVGLLHLVMRRTGYIVVVILIVCSFNGASLHRVNENWRKAGLVSRDVLADIGHLPKASEILITNLPDSINGAYIFRSGLVQAVALFGTKEANPVLRVLSFQIISSPKETVEAYCSRDHLVLRFSHNSFWITGPVDSVYQIPTVLPPGSKFGTASYDIHIIGPQGFAVIFKGAGRNRVVAHYSAGRLRKLSGQCIKASHFSGNSLTSTFTVSR